MGAPFADGREHDVAIDVTADGAIHIMVADSEGTDGIDTRESKWTYVGGVFADGTHFLVRSDDEGGGGSTIETLS